VLLQRLRRVRVSSSTRQKASLVTSDEVRRLRSELGLSARELGAVLGVDASTVHRWEAVSAGPLSLREGALKIEPMQQRLLELLFAGRTPADLASLGASLRAALLVGPSLALYTLLRWFFERAMPSALAEGT
jgi:DNA-binding transcriptional regulator YiaG